MLVYLGICAVLCFAGATAGALTAVLPAPTFTHLAFAAGAMPLVFGAIIHFVPVLTRTATPSRLLHYLPLAVQLAGLLATFGLAGWLPVASLHLAATLAALSALVLVLWIARRLRATLGAPHPGARWYGAALLCLFFAVSLVPVWLAVPGLRGILRLFHLHLNTLGFIGLAALGTLPVLLPTAQGQPDTSAFARLHRDLPLATAGALCVATGSMGVLWLAVIGALLLGWVAMRNLVAWWRIYGTKVGAASSGRFRPDGLPAGGMKYPEAGTAPLASAQAGFVLLLLAGVLHAFGVLAPRAAIESYFALFLLPLVTGALTQLLPVWRYPGPASARREIMRMRLAWGGGLRALLFFSGGALLVFDHAAGRAPVLIGLALFVVLVVRAFWLDIIAGEGDNASQA